MLAGSMLTSSILFASTSELQPKSTNRCRISVPRLDRPRNDRPNSSMSGSRDMRAPRLLPERFDMKPRQNLVGLKGAKHRRVDDDLQRHLVNSCNSWAANSARRSRCDQCSYAGSSDLQKRASIECVMLGRIHFIYLGRSFSVVAITLPNLMARHSTCRPRNFADVDALCSPSKEPPHDRENISLQP